MGGWMGGHLSNKLQRRLLGLRLGKGGGIRKSQEREAAEDSSPEDRKVWKGSKIGELARLGL